MKQLTTLWRLAPKRLLLAFGGMSAATALAIGGGSALDSASAEPSTVLTAGAIRPSLSDSRAGMAILAATNIVPGGTANGYVDIKNTGTAPGSFTLATSAIVDNPVSPGLSKRLHLVVRDLGDPACRTSCRGPIMLYTGTVNGMPPTIALGRVAVNEDDRYTFAVSFPDGGPRGAGADNAYQGASTSVEYEWSATS